MKNIENSDTVTISSKRYNDLLESECMLNHLYDLGVDNWEGYSSLDEDEIDEEDEKYAN